MTKTTTDILTSVQDLCAEILGVPLSRATPEARFVEDLEADSLFIIQLVIAVEVEFKILLWGEEAKQLATVQEMADFVAQRLQA